MHKREYIAGAITIILAICLLSMWGYNLLHTLYEEHTAIVNGTPITYLIKGKPTGKPVLLLHGNGGSHKDLYVMTDLLAQAGYLVWAPDSRGQGANPPLSEYHYADMADDMYHFVQEVIKPYYNRPHTAQAVYYKVSELTAALITSCENISRRDNALVPPAVFGWSDGGIIALMTEVNYPGTWSAIITSGANINPDCGAWDIEAERANPADTSALYRMMLYEPQMTAQDMASIQCPALIVAGENDLISLEHTHLIGDNIPNGQVMIVRGADHGSHIEHSPKMGRIVVDYLKQINY